jgi:MHS family shikimate/dehydroshikimate transporter-like MFS transporter
VVDWYDFLLYGITAALVFNREFFPQISPAMGTLAAFATFGVGFLFRPSAALSSVISAIALGANGC